MMAHSTVPPVSLAHLYLCVCGPLPAHCPEHPEEN